jgi:hypothetical protein
MMPAVLFAIAAFSTIFCTAVNAYTYRLAYPLWRHVGQRDFATLHREYLRLLTPVITLPHIVMFFASAALIWRRPVCLSQPSAIVLFALNATVVAVSAFWAGPIHTRFTRTASLDERGLKSLVRISALRTVLMLAASAIVCVAIASATFL